MMTIGDQKYPDHNSGETEVITKSSIHQSRKKERMETKVISKANTGRTTMIYSSQINHATTVHKLQGRTFDRLVIAEPSMVKNGAYVVLSRCTQAYITGYMTKSLVGMNGRSVFYITGYNTKAQQKEENVAFEAVSRVLVENLEKQVSEGIKLCSNHHSWANKEP